jgi:geranyl diphosphate 2-C-methyltransferase
MGQFNDRSQVARLYDLKTHGLTSPLNALLAGGDGLFFNHNGVDRSGRVDFDAVLDESVRLELLHAMEIDLVSLGLDYLGPIRSGDAVLDAGCGAGGGSVLLHERFGCFVEGVTLSPEQARFASETAAARRLDRYLRFIVGDMAEYSAGNGPYAGIWVCESTEHVDHVQSLFQAFRTALRPGARVVVIAWCAGRGPAADRLKAQVDEHYRTNIHRPDDYRQAASAGGLIVVDDVDLTAQTVPYWRLRARSAYATGSERFMTPGFERRQLTYRLFVLEAA